MSENFDAAIAWLEKNILDVANRAGNSPDKELVRKFLEANCRPQPKGFERGYPSFETSLEFGRLLKVEESEPDAD